LSAAPSVPGEDKTAGPLSVWRRGLSSSITIAAHNGRAVEILVYPRSDVMNLQLENKFALVTGSTAGIGFAIAKALAAEGARVIVNGRSEARVTEAIAATPGHIPSARLDGLALDLSKADASMQTIKRFPDVDILVNNLGVYQLKPFEQITDAEWSDIIETNVLSGVRLSRHLSTADENG